MVLLDLPDLTGSATGPELMLAAASAGAWRPVAVSVTANGLVLPTVSVARAAVMGRAVGALSGASETLRDERNSVVVQLIDRSSWLTSCDDDALAMGANLAAIGDELVQFGEADAIGPGRFRLSRLLRGRRGTEWAIAGHGPGEAFVLLDAARLTRIGLPMEMLGADVAVRAHGPGDAMAQPVRRTAAGEGLRPPAPSKLRTRREGTSLRVEWTRRSRAGWGWIDGTDAPIGEAVKEYRVTLRQGDKVESWTSSSPGLSISAEQRSAFDEGTATLCVVQVGDRAVSREAAIEIMIGGE